MSKTIVVIDAGHGYKPTPSGGVVYDPGAIGYLGAAQHREADIAALYANSLAYLLRTQHGIDAHLLLATREQHAHSVLQPLVANRAYNLGDAHTRYTRHALYIVRWSIETTRAHTQRLWVV
jgi:N-acetylmuramoyl-L-alanine amidase